MSVGYFQNFKTWAVFMKTCCKSTSEPNAQTPYRTALPIHKKMRDSTRPWRMQLSLPAYEQSSAVALCQSKMKPDETRIISITAWQLPFIFVFFCICRVFLYLFVLCVFAACFCIMLVVCMGFLKLQCDEFSQSVCVCIAWHRNSKFSVGP